MITRCLSCGQSYDTGQQGDCPACAGGFAAAPLPASVRPAGSWREAPLEEDDDPFPKPTEEDRRAVRRISRILLFVGWINVADLVASWAHLVYDLDELAPDDFGKVMSCACLGMLSVIFLAPILFLFAAASMVRRIEGRGIAITAAAMSVVMASMEMFTVVLAVSSSNDLHRVSEGAELRRSLNSILSSINVALTASLSIFVFVILLQRSMAGLFWMEARRKHYQERGRY